jgi:hypothetical protein
MKLAAGTQLALTRQGAFKSIILFKQRYNNALKAYNDKKTVNETRGHCHGFLP